MKTASNSRVLRTIPLLIAFCLVSFPAYTKYGGGTGKAMETGTYFSGLIDEIRIYNRAVKP